MLIKNGIHTGEALIVFVTRGDIDLKPLAEQICGQLPEVVGVVENINHGRNTALGKHSHTLAGRPYLFETLLGTRFKISPHAFFQVNTLQAENLFRQALKLANLLPTMHIIDAYCGVGTLSLLAAPHVASVTGIECVPEAIVDAKENAKINDISNCHFLCGQSEKLIKKADLISSILPAKDALQSSLPPSAALPPHLYLLRPRHPCP